MQMEMNIKPKVGHKGGEGGGARCNCCYCYQTCQWFLVEIFSSPNFIFHGDDLKFFQVMFLLQIWATVVRMLAYGHKKLLMCAFTKYVPSLSCSPPLPSQSRRPCVSM